MNKVYYNQADKRWANHPYTSKSHPYATIKSGGCGPTSAAMVVSNFLKAVYPNEMGDLFKKNGYRGLEGTDARAFYWVANKYNLKMSKSVYINDAVQCLKRGGMVIAHLYNSKKSLFSTGGHYVVLAGIDGNDIIVYDPYLYSGKFNSGKRRKVKVSGVECRVSAFNFKLYNDYNLYCFERPARPSYKYNIGDAVETRFQVRVIRDADESHYRVESNGYEFDLHKSMVKNLNADRIGNVIERGTIFAIVSDDTYGIEVLDRQFLIKEYYISKKLSWQFTSIWYNLVDRVFLYLNREICNTRSPQKCGLFFAWKNILKSFVKSVDLVNEKDYNCIYRKGKYKPFTEGGKIYERI